MDLRRRLAHAAGRRVAVLVVTVPGRETTRFAVERTLRQRGWRLARSPADADVLVVCGPPGPRLARAVDLVWEQLPGPRARVTAMTPSAAGAVLDQAVTELLDDDRQRRDAAERPTEPAMGTPPDEDPDDGDDGESADDSSDDETEDASAAGHGDTDHGGMDHGDMDHGDMDHGDMDMDMAPGGIPLAGGGEEDRDGLDLDVLHLPLGPVLPCWPAGLLLNCTVHGDVVMGVRGEVLGAADGVSPEPEPPAPAVLLDRAAQLLALAGWEAAATDAVRVRDGVLDGDPDVGAALDRLARRVRRSRLLRWSLRGVGHVGPDTCRELDLDRRLAGDVHDRLLALLTGAQAVLGGDGAPPAPVPLDALSDVLSGLELGAVRLTVASLGLDATVRASLTAGHA